MIYLVLSILCSTLIVLIFRAFPKYGVQSFQAIVFNYVVCVSLGLVVSQTDQFKFIKYWDGLWPSIILGSFFIFLFYAIAQTTQKLGVAIASVSQKLSFVVPVVAGILVFKEGFTFLKTLGVSLGIISVFLISVKTKIHKTEKNGHSNSSNKKPIISSVIALPLIVFLGSGASDLTVKVIESKYLTGLVTTPTFMVVMFMAALIVGSLRLVLTRQRIEQKNIMAGVILGFPNYGSVYFLILALQKSGLESSQVFPINNVAIILASALTGWLVFKENLQPRQLVGLAIAVAAILILI